MSASSGMTRDHWWWRPGWHEGRSFYTWHIIFPSSDPMRQITSSYAPVIKQIETLDPVGIDGIHMTLQGIGFTDEVSAADIRKIAASASSRCAQLEPIRVRIDEPRIDEEALHMNLHPVERLAQVKQELRNGIGDVWGYENIPESMDGFRPHISLAYSNGIAPMERIDVTIKQQRLPVTDVLVSSVSLLDLNRDHGRYEWTEIATVTLGPNRH
ncbi:MAG TPA: 2'-5' RNA ligase family protein [Pseudonocardiaceae bacterium]|nr:2'-5' RNA ligase family protein [Pseudonocardiaceae bacterium]